MERCKTLAAAQHGVLSRAQALGAAISRHRIHRLVGSGSWERLRPGVYRVAGAPATWHQSLMAACLWADPEAAASHRSAAALWELSDCSRGEIELSGARQRRRASGLALHRAKDLSPVDVTTARGIPATTPSRTLFDLAAVLSPGDLEAALEEALRRRLVTLARMRWRSIVSAAAGGRGRAACAPSWMSAKGVM